MTDLLFSGSAVWFTVPALVGTAFFGLRLGLMFVGGDADTDFDAHADAGMDADGVDDSTEAFKVLSVQSIAAFLMGYGWGALGGLRGFGWPVISSAVFGVATGVGMVWFLGKMLVAMFRLQSHGNVAIHDALGIEGNVYTEIPGQGAGKGQVRVIVGERERFFRAITEGERLESRSRVRIVRVNEDDTVTVTKA